MDTLNNVINSLKIIGISIAGIAFVVLMIKIAVEHEMKGRYLMLTKHLLLATILITVSLTLVDIPKSYINLPFISYAQVRYVLAF